MAGNGAPAQQAFADVAEAISRKTPVIMAVPHAEMEELRKAMPASVTLVEMKVTMPGCAIPAQPWYVTRREKLRRELDV